MTKPDPTDRLSAKEALQHPWIVNQPEQPENHDEAAETNGEVDSRTNADIPEVGACVIS